MAEAGPAGLPDIAPFAQWLGLITEEAANGRATLTLAPRPELLNRHGVIHGGVLATLLDSAMARASRSAPGVRELGGTTDLHVQYLRPAQGPQRVQAWVDQAAGTLSFCRAEVRNAAGELVASASASLRIRR